MLKTWIPEEIPEKEELKKRIKEAGEKLYQQQMKLKEHKLPVLVLFEGWGASGKGKQTQKRVYPTKAQFGLVPNWAFAVQRAAGWRLLKKSRYVLNEIAHTLPLIS